MSSFSSVEQDARVQPGMVDRSNAVSDDMISRYRGRSHPSDILPPSSSFFSLSFSLLASNACAHTHALHIYKYTYVKERNVMRRHHIAFPPFGNRALLDRPGRTYRRRANYHLNVWRPFRRAHSNLLARVRIFIKKGPRWRSGARLVLPLSFSSSSSIVPP